MIDLTGRTALVTGGARGLGRAIAEILHQAGANLVIVDQAETLDENPAPESWHRVPLDISSPEAESILSSSISELPSLSILVANAGIVPPWRRIEAMDFDEWERVFAVNVRGVALSLKAAAPALAKSGHGAALLMASINGYKPHADQTVYTSSKHAVVGLMRAAALDLGRDGVRVNALAPGPILTDALRDRITKRAKAAGSDVNEDIADLARETALGRLATEEDVARAACFLVSDLASGVTGTCLPVEAGLL